jgi:CRISPR-associated exonuclease Cas4
LDSARNITGVEVSYYFYCKRRCWLFAHGLQMEQTSDLVYTGKVVDDNSYAREEKGVDIDDVINIDWIDSKTGEIHEVKKSDSVEKAHEMQVLYYIWYLKQKGVEGITGEIDYPLLKQKTTVQLTSEKENELIEALSRIKTIVQEEQPPERINKKFCKTCSYFELCWTSVG